MDVVNNGDDARKKLKSQVYDAAVLDVKMPRKDGLAVLGELRQQGSHTQIVIVTSFATPDDLKHCVESGADATLPKPLDIGTLIGLLGSLRKIKQGK